MAKHPIFGDRQPTFIESILAMHELSAKMFKRKTKEGKAAAYRETRERFEAGYFKFHPVPKDADELAQRIEELNAREI